MKISEKQIQEFINRSLITIVVPLTAFVFLIAVIVPFVLSLDKYGYMLPSSGIPLLGIPAVFFLLCKFYNDYIWYSWADEEMYKEKLKEIKRLEEPIVVILKPPKKDWWE